MYFADKVCIACHEMKEPVRKWQEAGVAKNHRNCGGCHFDAGLARHWQMNVSAARFLVEHFQRDSEEPLKPPPEPLFVDPRRSPPTTASYPTAGASSARTPRTTSPSSRPQIHSKLMRFSNSQPCKDCHNHEMRKGQKVLRTGPAREAGTRTRTTRATITASVESIPTNDRCEEAKPTRQSVTRPRSSKVVDRL